VAKFVDAVVALATLESVLTWVRVTVTSTHPRG
jgi:hypothetical protein